MHAKMLLVLFCICFYCCFAAPQGYEPSDQSVVTELSMEEPPLAFIDPGLLVPTKVVKALRSAYQTIFRDEPRVTSALNALKVRRPYSLPFPQVTKTAPPAWFTEAPTSAQSVYLSMQTKINKVIKSAEGAKPNAAPEPTGAGKIAVAGLVVGALALL